MDVFPTRHLTESLSVLSRLSHEPGWVRNGSARLPARSLFLGSTEELQDLWFTFGELRVKFTKERSRAPASASCERLQLLWAVSWTRAGQHFYQEEGAEM